MIRISQLKLPITHTREQLWQKAANMLKLPVASLRTVAIVKRSVDARKKDQILFIYTLDVEADGIKDAQIVKRAKSEQVALAVQEPYRFPAPGSARLSEPPVIVGSGPAGLFAGLMLAEAGYCPLILERGDEVSVRRRKVERFWRSGELDVRSNVQFGEGGAGTFSDGKLNTLVKDPSGRNRKVLEVFVEHGADPQILYDAKPHIGTDVLAEVVKNMREHIISLGGQVRFGAQVTGLVLENGRVTGVRVMTAESEADSTGRHTGASVNRSSEVSGCGSRDAGFISCEKVLPAQAVILAIGHSARDTFSMLSKLGIPMQAKAFAVGLRIQHPQKMIDRSQYGDADIRILGPAPYKLTHQTPSGRGVYTFCMCPGGYVVNASSEPGRLAVNGMSNHARDGLNANSALIVTVTPKDFGGDAPLSGVEYQRRLEEAAFQAAGGQIPVQLYGDFRENRISHDWGEVEPQFRGLHAFANLRETLPAYLSDALLEGIECFGQRISGFNRYDAILAGIESRTSSPVRILRNECFESAAGGLFPCGEGAGYAGGITSAAIDGIKVAEEIARRYRPPAV